MTVNVLITRLVLKINALIRVNWLSHAVKVLVVKPPPIDQFVDVHLTGLETHMTNVTNVCLKRSFIEYFHIISLNNMLQRFHLIGLNLKVAEQSFDILKIRTIFYD